MLTEFMGWVRQIICLLIFLTLVLQILPNGNYTKYVKFFTGMIFVVTLLGPVISLFTDADWESLVEDTIAGAGEWDGAGMPDFEEYAKIRSEMYEDYAAEWEEDPENE